MKVDPIKKKKEEHVFHLKDAGEKPVYVTYPMLGIVAKMWVLDGEWEMHTIKEKPNFIKGQSPTALVFDEYNIHVLKKVISVRPLTEIPDKNTSLEIFKGGQIESYGRK